MDWGLVILTADIFKHVDTLKIYTKAHGSKTSNLIINLDHDDELMLNDDEATLADLGIENETEISFFNGAAYRAYQKKPEVVQFFPLHPRL